METMAIVAASGSAAAIVDWLSLRLLARSLGSDQLRSSTFTGRLVAPTVRRVGFAKGVFAAATVALYYGILKAVDANFLWDWFWAARDLLLGFAILGPIIGAVTRFEILRDTSSDERPPLDGKTYAKEARRWFSLVGWILLLLGVASFGLYLSALLPAASLFLFLARPTVPEAENRERDGKSRPSKGQKLVLALSATVLTVMGVAVTGASVASWQAADYIIYAAGVFEEPVPMRSSVISIESDGAQTPYDVPAAVLTWNKGEGQLNGITFGPWFSNKTLEASNETGTILRTQFRDGTVWYQSLDRCNRVSTAWAGYQAEITGANVTTFVRARKGLGIELRLDTVALLQRPNLYVTVTGTQPSSMVGLSCLSPELYLDGIRYTLNGTVFVAVKDFGFADIRITLGESDYAQVWGQARLGYRELVARFAPSGHYDVERDGIWSSLEGEMRILDARTVVAEFDAEDFAYRGVPGPLPSTIHVQGGRLFATSEQTAGPILPAMTMVYLVPNETLRVLIWGFVFGGYLLYVSRLYVMDSSGPNPGRTDHEHPKVAVTLVAAVILIAVVDPIVGPGAPRLSPDGLVVDAWYEEGLDSEMLSAVLPLWFRQLSALHSVNVNNWQLRSIPSDGIDEYTSNDPHLWYPSGRRAYDALARMSGISYTLHVTFLKGRGLGFGGVSNLGASIGIPLRGVESPLEILTILTHEFGHSLGLQHNQCSAIMTGEALDWTRLLPSIAIGPNSYRGRDLVSEARNGSLDPLPDWGNVTAQLPGRGYASPWAGNVTRHIFLFYNSTSDSTRELIFTSYLTAERQVIESLVLTFWPSGWFTDKFEVNERVRLAYLESGQPPATIYVPSACL